MSQPNLSLELTPDEITFLETMAQEHGYTLREGVVKTGDIQGMLRGLIAVWQFDPHVMILMEEVFERTYPIR